MKKHFLRLIAVILLCAILIGDSQPILASAAQSQFATDLWASLTNARNGAVHNYEDTASSAVAPENYVLTNVYIQQPKKLNAEADKDTKRVLLIEDVLPWDSSANQVILGSITEYDKVTTSQFLDVELEKYSVVVFANDQPFNTYENYTQFKEYLEIFASIGGVIVFGACDAGWSGGKLIEALPGDVTKTNHYEYRNYVADATHPIVSGILTEGDILTGDDLYSNYCSHISFDESSLPAGSTVILRETTSDRPTLVEYPLGIGRVIATGLTWEHNYTHGSSYGYGDFAKIAMEDMFRYAIRVSSINVDELHLLTEWRVKKNAHVVIVSDGSEGIAELPPIEGANVTVNNESFTTDADGAAYYTSEMGTYTVTISADGYRERKSVYTLKPRSSRLFFLKKAVDDGLPYVIQATAVKGGTYLDLLDQPITFTQDSEDTMTLTLDGNWQGHGAGTLVLYQESSGNAKGKYIIFEPGKAKTFSPGKVFSPDKQVKLKMVAQDGTESEPINVELKINKKLTESAAGGTMEEGLTSFDWIGNHPVQSDNEIFTKLLTTDMSIKSDLTPVEIVISHNDDGTVTYKAVIGLVQDKYTDLLLNADSSDQEDDGLKIPAKEAWNEWKKQINDYKTAKDPKTYLKNLTSELKDKYGGLEPFSKTKLKITGEMEGHVLGYFEVTYKPDGTLASSDGGLIVDFSYSFVFGQNFLAGPVPVYFEFKPGVKIELNAGFKFYDENGLKFEPDFKGIELSLPTITLGGGVGVSGVASVGVEGSGDMVFGFLGDDATSGKLKFGGAIKIKVLFVVDYKWDFWNTEVKLWPKKNQAKSLALITDDNFKLAPTFASRNYGNVSLWDGNVLGANIHDITPTNLHTLQYGVMPEAMPVIHQVGDKLVMLMLQDVSWRGIGNHTQLVYSVCENGYWTDPMPVMQSETGDTYFDSAVIDGQLYVTWQKTREAVYSDDPETLLAEVAKYSEICWARFNENSCSFVDQQFITNDETVDMMPAIAGDTTGIYIAWVNNDENNVLGTDGKNTFRQVAIQDGKMSEVTVLAQTYDYVTELVAGANGSGAEYLFSSMDAAGNGMLFHISGSKVKQLESTGSPAGLTFENGLFMWQEDGAIRTYDPAEKGYNDLVAGEASASYRYLSNGTDAALLWLGNDENGQCIRCSMNYDGTWYSPVTLLSGIENTVTFYDVEMLNDGNFAMVLNTADYDNYGNVDTRLQYAVVEPRTDLAVQLATTAYPDWENGKQKLTVYVENVGNTRVHEAELLVTSGEEVVLQQNLTLDLMPGTDSVYTTDLDISQVAASRNAVVTVQASADTNTQNNYHDIDFAQVDISLNYDVYKQGNEMLFIFTIANEAAVPASIALRINEDNQDGIMVDVKNLGMLGNDEVAQYVYAVDTSKIDFSESNYKTYYFQVQTLENDWNEYNNYCYYTISNEVYEETNASLEMDEYVVVSPTGVTITNGDIYFESPESDSIQLQAQIAPANATVTKVQWTVADCSIVHVTSTGLVTPLRVGKTTVTATDAEGHEYTIQVTVYDPNVLDTTALQDAIAKAESVFGLLYTTESYQALKDALKAAQDVLNDPNATQAQVVEATTALKAAKDALKINLIPLILAGAGVLLLFAVIPIIIIIVVKKKKKNRKNTDDPDGIV